MIRPDLRRRGVLLGHRGEYSQRAGRFRPALFRCLPLRRSSQPACGGGLIRRTVQHDDVGNLPSNGGFWRRSVFRWSVSSTGWEDARRSPCRRSHETTTGSPAVFRMSPSKRRCAPRRTTIPTGFRDDGLRDRCFSTVFVCLRGTADLSAAIVCYFAARRIAAQSRVQGVTGILG